jgi:protein gp37
MKNTNIAWCHHTHNIWEGCTKVGPGCDNCYAENRNQRFHAGNNWGPGAPRLLRSDAYWREPLKWERDHEAFYQQHGCRQRVFCSSLADVFDNEGPADQRARLFELIKATPHLDWLILTKRIGNAVKMLPADWGDGYPNVWLGATVVNQEEADRDIPKLLNTPARLRWLSMEPLLGTVKLGSIPPVNKNAPCTTDALTGVTYWPDCDVDHGAKIDWIVIGGESGHNARPMHPDWARSLRDQCISAGVPFLFKQWGEYSIIFDRDKDDPDWGRCDEIVRKNQNGRWINIKGGHGFHGDRVCYASKIGTKKSGRLLDGVLHDEFPT